MCFGRPLNWVQPDFGQAPEAFDAVDMNGSFRKLVVGMIDADVAAVAVEDEWGCRGRGVPAVCPARRRWAVRSGESVPPTSSSALARAESRRQPYRSRLR